MNEPRESLKPGTVFVIALVIFSLAAALAWPMLHRWQENRAQDTGGIIRIGANQAPASLDIRTEPGNAVTQALLGNVYQTVMNVDEHGNLKPGLATSWKRSGDGLTYTFHLNTEESFEDGSPVDSSAVLWSMQQVIEKRYPGYETFDNLARVTNPSDDELVIELKSPDSRLPYQLATRIGIVYNRGARVNYSNQSAGSGPYAVESFTPGQELVLRKSRNYRGPNEAKNSKVIFSYAPNSEGQAKMVSDRKLDAAVDLSPQEIEQAKTLQSGIKIATGLSDENLVLAFNSSKTAITSDQRFREAICYGIDRQAIADASGGTTKVLNGPLNALSEGYEEHYAPFPHDTVKASALASYFAPSYYNGHIRLVYEDTLGQTVGDQIKEQLKQANIPVEVTMVNHNTFEDEVVQKHNYDITLLKMKNSDLDQFADPKSTMLFDDPESQQLFHLLTDAKSQKDYVSQLKQYSQTVGNKAAGEWLTQKTPVNAKSSTLKGFSDNRTDEYLPAWNLQKH